MSLKVGMPAPEFKVEQFLKGESFPTLKRGEVYVLDFWATWCGPCVMTMPHLTELQREYRDKHVTICAVNVWQDPEYTESTLTTVTKFVKNKGDLFDFIIAYDGAAKHMDNTWLRAAGRHGIPCTFIVDQNGVIAWIGHPNMLDFVLDEITRGQWDIIKGPERLKAANAAFVAAAAQYKESLTAGDAAWKEANQQYPALGRTKASQQFSALLLAGHTGVACDLGNRLIDDASKARNAGPIMAVLAGLSQPKALKDLAARTLLLKASQANFELADTTEPGPHVIMSRAYFYTGRNEEARAAANKALDLTPAKARPSMEKWLKEIEKEAQQK